jgi:hypothetical protein
MLIAHGMMDAVISQCGSATVTNGTGNKDFTFFSTTFAAPPGPCLTQNPKQTEGE